MENINEIIQSDQTLDSLITNSIELIQYARQFAAKQVNLIQLMTYYSLGRWIVEVQQEGQERAKYGKKVITTLSEHLTEKFGRGFSATNLEYARKFYMTYADRISQTLFEEFAVKKPKQCLENWKKIRRLWFHGRIIYSLYESKIKRNAVFMR